LGSLSVLHWLIVLCIVGAIGYGVVRARKQAAGSLPARDSGTLRANAGPSGLRGWLMLVLLGQVSGIVLMLKAIMDETKYYKELPPSVHYLIHIEMVLLVAYAVLIAFTTVSMLRTERRFVTLWKTQAVITILFPVIDPVAISIISNTRLDALLDERVLDHVFGGTIGISIWWWYMNASVRVKNTFVN